MGRTAKYSSEAWAVAGWWLGDQGNESEMMLGGAFTVIPNDDHSSRANSNSFRS